MAWPYFHWDPTKFHAVKTKADFIFQTTLLPHAYRHNEKSRVMRMPLELTAENAKPWQTPLRICRLALSYLVLSVLTQVGLL